MPVDLVPVNAVPVDLVPVNAVPVDLVAVEGVPVDGAPVDSGSKTAAQTTGLLSRFRPGQSLDAELDAYERDRATDLIDLGAAATGDPAAAVRPIPVEETVPAAEAVAASVEETVPAAEALAASAPTTTPVEVTPPVGDILAQPTWQRVAPDPIPGTPIASPVAAPTSQPASRDTDTTTEPAWPAKPEWPPLATPSATLPFLGRPAARLGGPDALWAETAHEMVAPPTPVRAVGGVQPCISCGLSLSATARFCRRCGTSQGS